MAGGSVRRSGDFSGDHAHNALSYLTAIHESLLGNVKARAGGANGSDVDRHAHDWRNTRCLSYMQEDTAWYSSTGKRCCTAAVGDED